MITLTVIGAYILTSVLLFKYPTLVHRRKKLKFHCQHISHRGGAAENLENTIGAFDHAVKLGTDMLEIDLQLTQDNHVVVSHDNNLFRTTGINVNISDLTYKNLPQLNPAIPVDFDGGKLCQGGTDRQIPLLKEVFERYPDVAVNIDIKVNSPLLIKQVSDLIKQYKREEITVWGNFSNVVTNNCYKENPDIPMFFSARRVLLLIVWTYTGLLPFIPLRESCFETFMPSVVHKLPLRRESILRTLPKVALWLIDKLLMRKVVFEHLAKRGIQTYVWVVNDPDDFQKAFKLGVTGIMTDHPTRLRSFLNANKDWINR